MSLVGGTRLGAYEIVSLIGAGGMGEVYRAKDTRLARDVAVKVLPEELFEGEERRQRFEREAKLLAALNHPGIAAIHSFEEIPGASGSPSRHILVMELLEGETLRSALAGGRLPQRKAIDWALQIAHGLAAAHEKGIVHRDLKPDNLFVTKDGRLKILDFGLAKLTDQEGSGQATNVPTASAGTEPGVVMGTLGYMSPEQVKGRPADARADIFSFGAVLYEMLSGKRAFHGDSAAETMSAILREDPPDLSVTNQSVSPGLDRIVRHCIEKSPEQRFHSAHDVAFALEAVSGASTPAGAAVVTERETRPKWTIGATGLALSAAVGLAAFFAGRGTGPAPGARSVAFKPLTFRSLPIFRALFAPDGKTIVFSMAREGNKPELFTLAPEYFEPRPLGVPDAQLLSISSKGEIALLTHSRYVYQRLFTGTLARMPLGGGAPREVLEGVREADWSPDGESLAIIREVDGKDRLEYPIGKVLHATGGYLSDLRFSPGGDRIAFLEHPYRWDDRGGVAVVDLAGKKTDLAETYWGEQGLAWSPDGKEILFSAGRGYASFDVRAVTLTNRARVALPNAGGLTIFDVSRDGRWLAARQDLKFLIMAMPPGAKAERDLSWLEGSVGAALSVDGRALLFTEYSGSFGDNYAACLRKTDGSPVVRLGEGWAADLSPDGRWALAIVPTSPDRLMLYPTGPGEPRRLESGDIREYGSARWFPDGQRILTCGAEPKHASRCYVQDASGGKPRAVTAEGTRNGIVSPDGTLIVAQGSNDAYQMVPSAGGEPRPVSSLAPDETVARWTADGRGLLVARGSEVPGRLERVDLETGRRDFVRRLAPPDLAGVVRSRGVTVARDEAVYAYSIEQLRSDLFVVEGAR